WFWAFGGDYGPEEIPSDQNFLANGLVSPDRDPHPGLHQVKHVYRYLHSEPVDAAAGVVRGKNWYDFIDPADIATLHWTVKANGEHVQEGIIDVPSIEPGDTAELRIPFRKITPQPGEESFVELSFRLKEDASWAEAGHEIAWDEFQIP